MLRLRKSDLVRGIRRTTAPLLDDVPRHPLLDRLTDLDTLTDADRAALLHILDSLIANTRIRAALHNAG